MISIKDIMTTDVVTVKLDTPVYEALEILKKSDVSGLPVVKEDDEVVGILSEKDVLRILLDKNLDVKNTVADYMTRDVISFSEDDDAMDVCKFFINSPIRRVPIAKDNRLIGIVSRRDIVLLIIEAKSKISSFRYV